MDYKKTFSFWVITIIVVLLGACNESGKVKVGFVTKPAYQSKAEIDSISTLLASKSHFILEPISLEDVQNNQVNFSNIDILWYHRPDSAAISKQEEELGSDIKSFVSEGGRLLLTMDAVRLLNAWEIESEPLKTESDKVVDVGFGRKLGFHSYRGHPVFNKLHGGAYTWHSKKDHTERKVGFLGEGSWPRAKGSKVIGIDWSYITYHEDNKLLWETPLGEGSILAAGAYLHYSKPNFNRLHLNQFTVNTLNYLAGTIDGVEAHYWKNDPNKVVEKSHSLPDVESSDSGVWNIPESLLEMKRTEGGDAYWDISGRRMLIMGKEKGGIDEIWTHPIMSMRDFVPGIRSGSGNIKWLDELSPEITNRPDVLIRKYSHNSWKLKEVITASRKDPSAVFHYEWEGPDSYQLVFKMKTNLRQMWPYSSEAMGSLYYSWAPASNLLQVFDGSGDFNTLFGFNRKPEVSKLGHYDNFEIENEDVIANGTEKKQVAGYFEFDLGNKSQLDAVLSSGSEGRTAALQAYEKAIGKPEQMLEETAEYYKSFFDRVLTIETSDTTFNEGFKWALAGTDQFITETPGIGTSLMAGYGTSTSGWGGNQPISGRPGYAWYFGRDAVWSSFALNAYGDTEHVKDILKNFARFQDVSGKIYHEITTSGSVHYDASDATPLYIVLAGHYLRYSGDIEFIKEQWPKIKKAIDFCYRTDTDGDGLIENTNVGHGWIEGGKLFGAHTTLYLAGLWAAALEESSYLADKTGHDAQSDRYAEDAKYVQQKINGEFWDKDQSFYYYGKMADGSFNDEQTVLPAVPIYFGVIDSTKANQITPAYSTNNFSADWGVHILGKKSSLFNPTGYHYGSVWPLFTGWTALSEYQTGRINQGFGHIMNNLLMYKNWDQGSVEEVMHGELYQPTGVCHHQCWSETMVLQPALEGMLGLEPDALEGSLGFSPNFPWDWEFAHVKRIQVGESTLNFEMNRTADSTQFMFKSTGKQSLNLVFQPAFPLGTRFDSIFVNGEPVEYTKLKGKQSVRLQLDKLDISDSLSITANHSRGIGTIPEYNLPEKGADSRNFKVLDESFDGDVFTILVEGQPGSNYTFEVFSARQVRSVENAFINNREEQIYTIGIQLPESDTDYIKREINIEL